MDYYVEIIEKYHQSLKRVVELGSEEVVVDFILAPDMPSDNYHVIVTGIGTTKIQEMVNSEGNNEEYIYYQKHQCSEAVSNECKVEFYRLNKPDSKMVAHKDCCALATHLPTGITANCERFRSRAKNENEALCIIMSKLLVNNA